MYCGNCKYYDEDTGFCTKDYCRAERDREIEDEKADMEYDAYKHELED